MPTYDGIIITITTTQPLNFSVTTFNSASDAIASSSFSPENISSTIYVLHEFSDDSEYRQLASYRPPRSIIGLPALRSWLISMAHSTSDSHIINASALRLPPVISLTPGRHWHNFLMKDLSLCFYGFTDKQEAEIFISLCRWMGARVHKEFSSKIDILISRKNEAKGPKYRMALHFDRPILKIGWVECVWSNRFNTNFQPTSKEFMKQFEVKPLAGLKLAFINFEPKNLDEMHQVTIQNDGTVVSDPSDPECSHIVIDTIRGQENQVDFEFKSLAHLSSIYVVYKLWFWSSIELGRADESQEDHAFPIVGSKNSPARPLGSSVDGFLSPKMDYSISFTSPTIMTRSLLDNSILISSSNIPKPAIDCVKATDRFRVCYELLDTEKNYVNILRAIVNVFQKPLERLNYLDATEMKHIFGNVQPLVDVHERIYSQLQNLIDIDWKEENSIATVFIEHVSTR